MSSKEDESKNTPKATSSDSASVTSTDVAIEGAIEVVTGKDIDPRKIHLCLRIGRAVLNYFNICKSTSTKKLC